jgi:hypothetical protein
VTAAPHKPLRYRRDSPPIFPRRRAVVFCTSPAGCSTCPARTPAGLGGRRLPAGRPAGASPDGRRRRIPPEQVFAGRLAASVGEKRSSSSSVRRLAASCPARPSSSPAGPAPSPARRHRPSRAPRCGPSPPLRSSPGPRGRLDVLRSATTTPSNPPSAELSARRRRFGYDTRRFAATAVTGSFGHPPGDRTTDPFRTHGPATARPASATAPPSWHTPPDPCLRSPAS